MKAKRDHSSAASPSISRSPIIATTRVGVALPRPYPSAAGQHQPIEPAWNWIGLGLHATTVGEFDTAMDRALVHDGPCLIEVPIDPHDCSRELREWGSRVAVAIGRAPRLSDLRV